MTSLHTTASTLTVRLRPLEKIAGLLRDLEVPLASVTGVHVEPDGLAAVHGLRAPGLAIPGARMVGTWRGGGTRTMVSVRKDQPAVRVTLRGEKFDALVLGFDDAEAVADNLRTKVS